MASVPFVMNHFFHDYWNGRLDLLLHIDRYVTADPKSWNEETGLNGIEWQSQIMKRHI
jgi:hypothetical protein